MKYNDIKQRVYDELSMPVAEAVRAGYSSKIHRIFNEAVFRIAHAIMPNLRAYKFTVSIENFPIKITMPPDFISFADEQNAYINGKNFILTKFVDSNGLILDGNEANVKGPTRTYIVYYNASYPKIVDGGTNYEMVDFIDGINEDCYAINKYPTETIHNNQDTSYDWPDIIGNLVPHYIVSRLLVLDDKVRSIEEMNIFETLLATVNVDRNERQREYHSVRGWY